MAIVRTRSKQLKQSDIPILREKLIIEQDGKEPQDTIHESWLFNKEPFADIPDGAVGFVYLITRMGEQGDKPIKYIGKKLFYSKMKVSRVGSKRKSIQYKESNWKTYFGSSEELLNDVTLFGKNMFIREILHICNNREEITYLEVYEQFERDVLCTSNEGKEYYNKNILGKFYKSHQKDVIILSIQSYWDTHPTSEGNNKEKKWINNGRTNKVVPKTEASRLVKSGRWIEGRVSKKYCFTNGKINIYEDKDFLREGFYKGCIRHRITNGKNNKCLPIEDAVQFIKDNEEWKTGFCGNVDTIWVHNGEEEVKINKNDFNLYKEYEFGRLSSIFPRGYKMLHKNGVIQKVHPKLIPNMLNEGWELGNPITKGTKSIHKGQETIRVTEEDLILFLTEGWELGNSDECKSKLKGRPSNTLGRIALCKNGITKFVNPDEITSAHNIGWKIGSSNKPMLGKKHSEDAKLAISKSTAGNKNPNAQHINICNSSGKIIYKCNGNFKKTCIDNNLPFGLLRHSLLSKIHISVDSKYKEFVGWYAEYDQTK